MKKIIAIAMVSTLLFCSSSLTSLNRQNDYGNNKKWEKAKVSVLIETSDNAPNRVSVWNGCNYEKFNIYKQDDSTMNFRLHGTLSFVPGPNAQCLVLLFEDMANSKPYNKYKVKPIENGIELDTIKSQYAKRK
jgi:hypothetical protein